MSRQYSGLAAPSDTSLYDEGPSLYPDDELEAAESLYGEDDAGWDDDDGDDDLALVDSADGIPSSPPPDYPATVVPMCIVCHSRPAYSQNGRSYPTCGLTCADKLKRAQKFTSKSRQRPSGRSSFGSGEEAPYEPTSSAPAVLTYSNPSMNGLTSHLSGMKIEDDEIQQEQPQAASDGAATAHAYSSNIKDGGAPKRRAASGSGSGSALRRPAPAPVQVVVVPQSPPQVSKRPQKPRDLCIVCKSRPCYEAYLTCGLKCARKLAKGPPDAKMCNYCHRRPKLSGYHQCGDTCKENAKTACLLCRCRPKYKRYHLCGKTCKLLATEHTPLILHAPEGHTTHDLVVKRFKAAWKVTNPACPPIKQIYKIIESASFLKPYDVYKRKIGMKTEVFRYHGTSRKCTLGNPGNTSLCSSTNCPLCSILRTSFKVSLANPSGAFGAGVYSSSAANKAFSYSASGTGAILLCKVVLGTVRNVTGWNEVMSCPAGFDSVVFDRMNGTLNETIVYTDDAIRPVFLLIF